MDEAGVVHGGVDPRLALGKLPRAALGRCRSAPSPGVLERGVLERSSGRFRADQRFVALVRVERRVGVDEVDTFRVQPRRTSTLSRVHMVRSSGRSGQRRPRSKAIDPWPPHRYAVLVDAMPRVSRLWLRGVPRAVLPAWPRTGGGRSTQRPRPSHKGRMTAIS